MILKQINELVRQGRRYRRTMFDSLDLSSYPVSLVEIADHPGLSQDQLAQLMCFDKSNAARRVAALEEEGFISRSPSARDKRVMELTTTEKAETVLPDIRRVLSAWDAYLTEDMTAEERQVLERLLERMKKRAVNWRKEDAHV